MVRVWYRQKMIRRELNWSVSWLPLRWTIETYIRSHLFWIRVVVAGRQGQALQLVHKFYFPERVHVTSKSWEQTTGARTSIFVPTEGNMTRRTSRVSIALADRCPTHSTRWRQSSCSCTDKKYFSCYDRVEKYLIKSSRIGDRHRIASSVRLGRFWVHHWVPVRMQKQRQMLCKLSGGSGPRCDRFAAIGFQPFPFKNSRVVVLLCLLPLANSQTVPALTFPFVKPFAAGNVAVVRNLIWQMVATPDVRA